MQIILHFCGISFYIFAVFCFTFLWHSVLHFCGKADFSGLSNVFTPLFSVVFLLK